MAFTLLNLARTKSGEILFRNAQWHPFGCIDCEIQFAEYPGEWYPFTASADDEVAHGRELFDQLSTTYANEVEPCSESTRYELAVGDLMSQRAIALQDSDWLACNDVVLENQADWLDYRQAWRDITLQAGYPYDVEIPLPPPVTANVFRLDNLRDRLSPGGTK